jgi:tRNA threonylcarbamoyladenosine biosynthesis protein TsaB
LFVAGARPDAASGAGGGGTFYAGRVFLGIDTSLGTAVAVVEADGYVVAEKVSENPLGHAEAIGTLLADAIDGDVPVTHVAVGMGPGPFTGLRVGIAAARTFALGRGVPIVPVPSHDAVALGMLLGAAAAGLDVDEPFAVVTDARRREFAYSVYTGLDDDGLPLRVAGPALAPRDEVDARLAELGARRRDAASVSAAMIALAAARAVAAGRELADAEPLYLRAPDVAASHAPKKVRA